MVGARRWPVSEISIAPHAKGGKRIHGVFTPPIAAPYLPKKITDPYHPTGNSVGYMVQTAHLMGCDPIYLLGFTLQSGSPYFFGRDNPVTKHHSLYSNPDRSLVWLKWYEKRYPGRLRLWPGWEGPIYDSGILQVAHEEARQEVGGQAEAQDEPEADGADGSQGAGP